MIHCRNTAFDVSLRSALPTGIEKHQRDHHDEGGQLGELTPEDDMVDKIRVEPCAKVSS